MMTEPGGKLSTEPQGSLKALRFLVGLVVTIAMMTVYTAAAYWLGFRLIHFFQGSFLGFAVGIWLGTPVIYTLNFFRPRLERAILEELEDLLLSDSL